MGALLKAMAPVAVQSMYSMQLADPNKPKRWNSDEHDPEERVRAQAFVRNSCHVWVDEGRMMTASDRRKPLEAPLWIRHRLEKLGRSNELAKWK